MRKPENIEEYKKWLKSELDIIIEPRTINYYNLTTKSLKLKMEESEFWKDFTTSLSQFNQEFTVKTDYQLLIPELKLDIYTKPFDSLFLKTYRKNVLNNSNWPNQPEGGWIIKDNWFEKINDIIRTSVFVKYLDGVEFLGNKLQKYSEKHKLDFNIDFEAREEGYYAAHANVKKEFEVEDIKWDTIKFKVNFEIQITTQLQDVIKKLLHKYYEKNRKKIDKDKNLKWQWDYKSDEFSSNYLGHILHYVEGMIMEIRYKQKIKK